MLVIGHRSNFQYFLATDGETSPNRSEIRMRRSPVGSGIFASRRPLFPDRCEPVAAS